MAILTTQTILESGISVAYSNAGSTGDKVSPSRRTFLHIKNDGASVVTVTVDDKLTPIPAGSVAFDPDVVVDVPASEEKFIGPIVEARFQGTDGYADVSYSEIAGVSLAVISV